MSNEVVRRRRLWSRGILGLHIMAYGVGVVALVVVDSLTSPEKWWSHWALLGWGVVVLLHALFVFGSHSEPDAERGSRGG